MVPVILQSAAGDHLRLHPVPRGQPPGRESLQGVSGAFPEPLEHIAGGELHAHLCDHHEPSTQYGAPGLRGRGRAAPGPAAGAVGSALPDCDGQSRASRPPQEHPPALLAGADPVFRLLPPGGADPGQHPARPGRRAALPCPPARPGPFRTRAALFSQEPGLGQECSPLGVAAGAGHPDSIPGLPLLLPAQPGRLPAARCANAPKPSHYGVRVLNLLLLAGPLLFPAPPPIRAIRGFRYAAR